MSAHTAKFRRSYWIKWALTPMTVFCVSSKRFGDIQTKIEWGVGGHVTIKAATSQRKLRILVTSRSWMRQRAFQESMALPAPWLHISKLRNHEKILFLS